MFILDEERRGGDQGEEAPQEIEAHGRVAQRNGESAETCGELLIEV